MLTSQETKLSVLPPDQVYSTILDIMRSRTMGSIEKIEITTEPSYIKARFGNKSGSPGSVAARILSDDGGSTIIFTFNFRKFIIAFFFLVITVNAILVTARPASIEFLEPFIVIWLVYPIVSVQITRSKFMQKVDSALRNMEMEYKKKMDETYFLLKGASSNAQNLYRKLENKHSSLYLRYKIKEYMKYDLNLEEAIRKIAEEEKIT